MAVHAHGKALNVVVEQEHANGVGSAAKVAHQLDAGLGDIGSLAKLLSVAHAVIALIRLAQLGILAIVPVKVAAVDDHAAHHAGMAVQILGGGMGDDIRAELEGTAQNGRSEGVVHDQGHIVAVSQLGIGFDIQHRQRGIGDGFTEHQTGTVIKESLHLIFGHIRGDEAGFDAHALHGDGKQVQGAAVNAGGGHDVVARGSDVEHRHQGRRLTGGSKHSTHAALHGRQLLFHAGGGGVGNAGIHMAIRRQVEQLSQKLGGFILIGGTLVNGQDAGLAVFRLVAFLQHFGLDMGIRHG